MERNDDIDITGLDRAEVLAALCNGTCPMGLGALNKLAMEAITPEHAREFLGARIEGPCSVDYVFGRPIKVGFETVDGVDWLTCIRLYDRDAGQGAAARVIEALREAA